MVGTPLPPRPRRRQEAGRGREGEGADGHPPRATRVSRHRCPYRGRRPHHRRRPRGAHRRHAESRRRGRAHVRRGLAAAEETMKTLEGRIALVTGAGSGIGRVTARLLAAEGARVALVGRRKEPLEQVVKEIQREQGIAVARTCDLTRSHDARDLGAWAVETLGGIDILINNAGQSSHARSIRWIGQDEWDAVLAVNTTGVYALTQAVLPSL